MSDTYTANIAGEKLLFLFGDGGSPTEEFASSCSINTSTKLDLISAIYEGKKANCTDPSAPSMTTRRVQALDVKFTGEGMADANTQKALVQRWKAGAPFNAQVVQDLGTGFGWTISGPWVIESLGIGGAWQEDQPFSISIAIAGEFDFDEA